MRRPSTFLTLTRQAIQPHADAGLSVPADAVLAICDLLRLLAAECERIECRLAGAPLETADEAGGNVVSMSAWLDRKGAAHDEH